MATPTQNRDESRGARPIGAPARKKGLAAWLIPLALFVVALIVLLLLLSQCGGSSSDTKASSSATPTAATTSTSSAAPSPTSSSASGATSGSASGTGTVDAEGVALLPLKDGATASLADFDGKTATTDSVQVQSVPADEGFWVGSSKDDRVWVQLSGGAGESPFTVKTGDKVSFTGTVTKNDAGFADKAGITADEGKAQLDSQGYHVAVKRTDLKLTS